MSDEFETLLKKNGIKHVKTPPYHPASNGLVERAVQTFKSGMKKLTEGSVETKVSRFLFKYRLTPQSNTGVSPAELMFGRKLRSPLDNIRPSLERKVYRYQERQKTTHDSHARWREFQIGDTVYVRNYAAGDVWLPGTVVKKLGSTMYAVLLEDGRNVRKHTDQIRLGIENRTQSDSSNEGASDDPLEMRVPRTDDSNDPNDSTDSSGGNAPPVSETVDTSQEQEQNRTEQSTDPLTQLRRSDRVRNPTDYYGVFRI